MGLNLHIIGIRDKKEKFDSMIELKLLCEKNKTSYPKELKQYFGDLLEEEVAVIEEEMNEEFLNYCNKDFITEINEECFEIDIEKLPKEFKKLKVELSY